MQVTKHRREKRGSVPNWDSDATALGHKWGTQSTWCKVWSKGRKERGILRDLERGRCCSPVSRGMIWFFG